MRCITSKLKVKGNYLCESKLIWSCIPKSWKEILARERVRFNRSVESDFHQKNIKPLLKVQFNIKTRV